MLGQANEAVQVHHVPVREQNISGVPPRDSDFTGPLEQPANPAQVRIENVARLLGRIFSPDPVDKSFDRDRTSGVNGECGEHGLLPRRTGVERLPRYV